MWPVGRLRGRLPQSWRSTRDTVERQLCAPRIDPGDRYQRKLRESRSGSVRECESVESQPNIRQAWLRMRQHRAAPKCSRKEGAKRLRTYLVGRHRSLSCFTETFNDSGIPSQVFLASNEEKWQIRAMMHYFGYPLRHRRKHEPRRGDSEPDHTFS